MWPVGHPSNSFFFCVLTVVKISSDFSFLFFLLEYKNVAAVVEKKTVSLFGEYPVLVPFTPFKRHAQIEIGQWKS